MLKPKSMVITFAIAAIVVCACVGIGMKHNYDENVANEISTISTEETKFDKANYSTKLQYLKGIKSDLNTYKNGKEKDSKVVGKYDNAIKKETLFFITDYNKKLDVPTIIAVNMSTLADENKIKVQKKSVDDELIKIESESDVTLTSDELTKYKSKVSALDKTYNGEISSIEKKIAEAKAKAVAAAKVKAEAVAKAKAKAAADAKAREDANSNSGSNNGNTSGSNGSSGGGYSSSRSSGSTSGYNSNGSSNNYSHKSNSGSSNGSRSSGSTGGAKNSGIPSGWIRHDWSTDSSGNKIPGTDAYHYRDGTSYFPADGSTFNIHDW